MTEPMVSRSPSCLPVGSSSLGDGLAAVSYNEESSQFRFPAAAMYSRLTVSLIAVIVPARPNGARPAFCPALFLLKFGCLHRRQSQW
jgi:hypothetical protein